MGTATVREQSGVITAKRVAGQVALGRALGMVSGGALIVGLAVIDGPDTVALAVGIGVGLFLVLLERLLPANATLWGVRQASEVSEPIDVTPASWWEGPLAWGTNAALAGSVASAAHTLFGDGAAQAAVLALVVGAANLASWLAIRRLERTRECLAVELAAEDPDDDASVVLYRRVGAMAAFGR